MRLRRAVTAAMLGTALTLGTVGVPAQAAAAETTSATAAAARWVTVAKYFLYVQCELKRLDLERTGLRARCADGGPFAYWKLQVLK
ncbi:hypothetical protein ITP53_53860 [Nonomuraea sp. K274]|uniref:Uncharacterized protein n=1 Tax=Nonomuraea cypriaca TaxID=1187855 RepID=A0A931APK5_9ACTN|nr:hypothetical protein [Nonomuraea cypriaca]MBF8194403.1 hypothetical protein [Nonomuraea cypriaca]